MLVLRSLLSVFCLAVVVRHGDCGSRRRLRAIERHRLGWSGLASDSDTEAADRVVVGRRIASNTSSNQEEDATWPAASAASSSLGETLPETPPPAITMATMPSAAADGPDSGEASSSREAQIPGHWRSPSGLWWIR